MGWRGSQEAIWKFGVETQGRLPSGATAVPACPALSAVGVSSLPSVSNGESPVPIYSIGAYQMLSSRKGIRDYTINANLTIGNAQFLKYALRSSGLGVNGIKSLPALAMGIGAMNSYGDGFAWLARYCLIESLAFNFQVGQPVTAQVSLVPLLLDFTESDAQATALKNTTTSAQDILAAAGDILAWDNLDVIVGGSTNISEHLESVSVRISNQIDRVGQRRDKGDDKPYSRIRQALVPLNESVSVSYSMGDKLANQFRIGSCNATLWGQTVLHAYNSDNGCGGTKSLKITIDHNRLSSEQMNGVQAGQRMTFSAETLSGFVSIEGS